MEKILQESRVPEVYDIHSTTSFKILNDMSVYKLLDLLYLI
jgi:hypothetical protein